MEQPYKLSIPIYMVHLFVAKLSTLWKHVILQLLDFLCYHSSLTTHMIAFPYVYCVVFITTNMQRIPPKTRLCEEVKLNASCEHACFFT